MLQTGKPSTSNAAFPGFFEPLDAVGRKDQIQVEWTILQLYEVLTTENFLSLLLRDLKIEIRRGLSAPTSATPRPSQLGADLSTKSSAFCSVSGKPSRIAPDFPMDR
jgi:hypothetical protein